MKTFFITDTETEAFYQMSLNDEEWKRIVSGSTPLCRLQKDMFINMLHVGLQDALRKHQAQHDPEYIKKLEAQAENH